MKGFEYSYASEKFYDVLRVLATGRNDARWRIWYAHWTSFSLLREEHVPPDLRNKWKGIWKILRNYLKGFNRLVPNPGHLSEPPDPFLKMKNSTAEKIANELFEIGLDIIIRFEIEMFILNLMS